MSLIESNTGFTIVKTRTTLCNYLYRLRCSSTVQMSEWREDSISCFRNCNGGISVEGVFIRRKTCAGGVIKFPSFSLISLSTRPAGPHRKWHYFPDAATGAPERRTPDTPRYHSGPLQPTPPQKLSFENCSYFLGSVLHFFVFESSFKIW